MHARMGNPALLLPDAMQALQSLGAATENGSVPGRTLGLVHLRASQINGCAVCMDQHPRYLLRQGETEARLRALEDWQAADCFTDAERAALALAESVTTLAGPREAVPDDIWEEAVRHYDEAALAALILSIALVNVWNRLNIATRQAPGAAWA